MDAHNVVLCCPCGRYVDTVIWLDARSAVLDEDEKVYLREMIPEGVNYSSIGTEKRQLRELRWLRRRLHLFPATGMLAQS